MNIDPIFLTVEHVIAIHGWSIKKHGGSPEIRDHGLLESAVFMPQSKFGGQFLHEGLPAMAAAYLFHICKNHAFVDGNKRTAVASAEIFVDLNGWKLAATDKELERITLGVADSSITKDELTKFFRRHVRRDRKIT